jgi:hypothetical protein
LAETEAMKCLACNGAKMALHGAEQAPRLCMACDGTGEHDGDVNRAYAKTLGPCNCEWHDRGPGIVTDMHLPRCRLYARPPKSDVEIEVERRKRDFAEESRRLGLYRSEPDFLPLARVAVAHRRCEESKAKLVEWLKSEDGQAWLKKMADRAREEFARQPMPHEPTTREMWAWQWKVWR